VPDPVRVRILGVGMGPQHVTPEVAEALRSVDYVLAADKGSDGDDDGLLALRRVRWPTGTMPGPLPTPTC
jgi:precorrin-6A synthase